MIYCKHDNVEQSIAAKGLSEHCPACLVESKVAMEADNAELKAKLQAAEKLFEEETQNGVFWVGKYNEIEQSLASKSAALERMQEAVKNAPQVGGGGSGAILIEWEPLMRKVEALTPAPSECPHCESGNKAEAREHTFWHDGGKSAEVWPCTKAEGLTEEER